MNWNDEKVNQPTVADLQRQLAAALAACKLKNEALQHLLCDVGQSNSMLGAVEARKALAIQPDDSALKSWLGEPIAKKIKYGVLQFLDGYSELPPNTELYSPKGLVEK